VFAKNIFEKTTSFVIVNTKCQENPARFFKQALAVPRFVIPVSTQIENI